MASSARIEELRKKFEENPRRYFAPLANEYRKAGDIEQAISICREYLPQQPGHMSGHIVYGQALYEARQFDEAKSVFETALTLDPENLIALRHLGDISLMVGDGDAARSWYKRVLEADPRNEEIQAQLARIDQSGAPTPVAGTSSAPTPALGTEAVPVTPAATNASSAATVVIDPSKLPLSKPSQAQPTETSAPPLESLSSTPTAEIHLGPPPSLVEESKAPPAAGPVERLELDSPVPGTFDDAGTASISLTGLETTSLAAETAEAPVPSAPAPPAIELDMPPADAMPLVAAAPVPPAPLGDIELSVPAETPAAAAPIAAPIAASDPELLDLSLPAPSVVETTAAPPPPAVESTPAPAVAELPRHEESPGPVAQGSPLDNLPIISDPSETPEPSQPPEPAPGAPPESGPFVTETMAELYLKQGHLDDALRVYRALLDQRPGDTTLQAKIASLQTPPTPAAPPAPPARPEPPVPKGPTIREVLTLVATRRPGHRPASQAGNGAGAPTTPEAPVEVPTAGPSAVPAVPTESGIPAAAPPATESTPPVTAAPPATAAAPTDATPALGPDLVGAFFGHKPVADADDAAARTLALAFSSENGRGGSSSGGIGGTPARVAPRELSLDAVFASEQPPASPSNFSFDQFFSKGAAADDAAPAAPANADSQDDVAEFTSWLQGLKRK